MLTCVCFPHQSRFVLFLYFLVSSNKFCLHANLKPKHMPYSALTKAKSSSSGLYRNSALKSCEPAVTLAKLLEDQLRALGKKPRN